MYQFLRGGLLRLGLKEGSARRSTIGWDRLRRKNATGRARNLLSSTLPGAHPAFPKSAHSHKNKQTKNNRCNKQTKQFFLKKQYNKQKKNIQFKKQTKQKAINVTNKQKAALPA